ncbi:MAG: glycosyltransferase [Nannocystaceae bacterium]
MNAWVEIGILCYFLLLNGCYTILVYIAGIDILHQFAVRRPECDADAWQEWTTPPVTIIAPAYNEELTIIPSVLAFLGSGYPRLSIVVVNDGSRDGTLDLLRRRFALEPSNMVTWRRLESKPVRGIYRSRTHDNLLVVDKENGGKADALNAGLNLCRSPLVCCVDADTLIEKGALLRMVGCFFHQKDRVIAVGGTLRVANGCTIRDGVVEAVGWPKGWLARFQVFEYLRSFLFGRMGFNPLRGSLIVSGAFAMFDCEAVVKVGGYLRGCVGEDMELIIRLHREFRRRKIPYRVHYIAEPICYTQVPESVRTLGRQRDRWQRGLCDALWRHRNMCFNPRYGATGMIVYPFFLFFEFFGPPIEMLGYLWFTYCIVAGELNTEFAVLFACTAFLWGLLISVQAILLEAVASTRLFERPLRGQLLFTCFAEWFGYRQLSLSYRLRGLAKYFMGAKSWGRMKRRSLGSLSKHGPAHAGPPYFTPSAPRSQGGGDLEAEAASRVSAGTTVGGKGAGRQRAA